MRRTETAISPIPRLSLSDPSSSSSSVRRRQTTSTAEDRLSIRAGGMIAARAAVDRLAATLPGGPSYPARLLLAATDDLRDLSSSTMVAVLERLSVDYGLPTTMRAHRLARAAKGAMLLGIINPATTLLTLAHTVLNPVARAVAQVPPRFPTVFAPPSFTDGEARTDEVLSLLADSLAQHCGLKKGDTKSAALAVRISAAMQQPVRHPEQDGDRTRRWFIMFGMSQRLDPAGFAADEAAHRQQAGVVAGLPLSVGHNVRHLGDAAGLAYSNRPIDAFYATFTGDPSAPEDH